MYTSYMPNLKPEKQGSVFDGHSMWAEDVAIRPAIWVAMDYLISTKNENPLILPVEGSNIDLWGAELLQVRWRSVEKATTYIINVMCTWETEDGEKHRQTLYTVTIDSNDCKGMREIDRIIPITARHHVTPVAKSADIHALFAMEVKQLRDCNQIVC